ncbi:DinB family protein [Brachybacterium alimentarium]|uniref:DinB family protein n=1 Tax=Brachybacterium alimentarium TaxID=47845 RepID=UPI001C6A33EF|nr:DinB family protein [Brachybacterium alimentarium]
MSTPDDSATSTLPSSPDASSPDSASDTSTPPSASDTSSAAPSPAISTARSLPATRVDPPPMAGERESLDAWIEYYRETALRKIDGLDAEQLCTRSVPPSALSPIGIIRHLTDNEAYWLREVLLDDEQPDPHCSEDNPDGDFEDIEPATALADIEAYRQELDATRAAQASWSALDGPVRGLRHGEHVNLRWILTHLIEEYARHLGHLDLLCEVIDGRTGE